MQVIFIKDLKNQGKKGDIKEVKDGYAKNFLIKNGYAVVKTEKNILNLENEKAKEAQLDEDNTKKANLLKEKLEKENYKFVVKAGKNDKIFGSVSAKQITEKLSEKYDINKNQVLLKEPLTSLGYHEIEINLYRNIKAKIKVELIK